MTPRTLFHGPSLNTGLIPRLLVGVGAVAAAILVRVPFEPILQGRNTFILLEPAIAIAAWYGGLVSGTTATAVGIVASAFLYLGGPGGFAASSRGDFVSLMLFSVNGMLLTFLSSGLKSQYRRANEARMRAEHTSKRNQQLQSLAVALNRPMSPQVLAQTSIEQSLQILGANGGLVAVGRKSDDRLRVLAALGFTGEIHEYQEVSNDPDSPLGEVIRSGEPLILRGRVERATRYPKLADRFQSDGDSIILPLRYQETANGTIYLNFEGRTPWSAQDRDFLLNIGVQCGSALERSFLIERMSAMALSERARAAELGTVLEAIGDGLLVGDSSGKVTISNPAARRLLGQIPVRIMDLPVLAEEGSDEDTRIDRYLARSPVRPDGWLEISRFPVDAEVASSDVVVIRDVTQSVEADKQREAFLGVLSHELRTPVTSIMVAVDLLRDVKRTGQSHRAQLLGDIDAETARLHRIVEDLLVLTRSERGALDATGEPVLVHRLVREVVERAREDSPDVEIKLTASDGLPPVEAEPTYVQQIVRNYLSNAIKYGRNGDKPIEVIVAQQGDYIDTRVLDRGVGLDPDETELLFTLFYRNPKVSSAPGAGIGLYVCRLLAEAMGGKAWARPRPGGGSEFGVSLPLIVDLTDLPSPEPVASESAVASGNGRSGDGLPPVSLLERAQERRPV